MVNYEKRYKKTLEILKSLIKNDPGHVIYEDEIIERFPELKESGDERIRKELIEHCRKQAEMYNTLLTAKEYSKVQSWLAWLEKQGENNMGISETTKQELEDSLNKSLEKETPESCNEFLEKQGEQKPAEWNIFDFRTWQYIVSDVLTKKDGIGQYLDSGECKKVAKYMQEEWSKKLSVEQMPKELLKSEDYGVDGLYHAISILKKTLGKVEGYQSDDGILEHKIAIDTVKALYEKKSNGWTEEDLHIKGAIVEHLVDNELIEWANWLNNAFLLEQKPADKVEPKFKVGDRIRYKYDGYNRYKIESVGTDYYVNGFGQRMDMSYTDANFEIIN